MNIFQTVKISNQFNSAETPSRNACGNRGLACQGFGLFFAAIKMSPCPL